MAAIARKNVKLQAPEDMLKHVPEAQVMNIMMYKALKKMEYFRTRCKEMEEKYGVDYLQFKDKLTDSEAELLLTEWEEMVLWEEYFNSFKEWENKYKALNRFLK